jgi:hypothetical protein
MCPVDVLFKSKCSSDVSLVDVPLVNVPSSHPTAHYSVLNK